MTPMITRMICRSGPQVAKPHLIVPYTLDTGGMRFATAKFPVVISLRAI